jgi:sec-independent protein translocase protein TatB
MFDIGWSELVVIGIVALIAIGPKELPAVLRTVGQYMGKVRRMASEFQGQFQEAMREAEMAELKKEVDDLTGSVSDYANFDPMESVRKEVESLAGDPLADDKTTDPGAIEASPEAAMATPPAEPDAAVPQPASAEPAVAEEPPQPKPAPASGSGG